MFDLFHNILKSSAYRFYTLFLDLEIISFFWGIVSHCAGLNFVSPTSICSSSNSQYLRMELYLETVFQFSSLLSFSHVQLFATPWTAAHQASLSITNSWSLLRLTSIESVMPSNHLILCHLLLLLPSSFPIPSQSGSFLRSQLLASGGQSVGASASTSVLPMNIQGWFPLGWTGWISLQSKGLSRIFSSTTVKKHQFFSTQPSL